MNRPLDTWSERHPSFAENRRFQRLLSLHALTDAWIRPITGPEEPAHRVDRMAKLTLNPNLWLFEKSRLDQFPLRLEDLVGAQTVSEFLNELKEMIWIIQASTLENALAQSKEPEELESLWSQASWNHGKTYSEHLWSTEGRFSLEETTDATLASHFYEKGAWILERISSRESSLLWIQSPHQNGAVRSSSVITLLTSLHLEWMKGFIYGLSRRVRVLSSTLQGPLGPRPRITLLWT